MPESFGKRALEEGGEIVDDRTGPGLADLPAGLGCQTVDLALDLEEPADALERLGGDRRLGGEVDVVDLAPDMGPAGDFGHGRRLSTLALIERREAGIAVGLEEAAEARRDGRADAPLAIGRVAVDDRRRGWPAIGPLVAQIDP